MIVQGCRCTQRLAASRSPARAILPLVSPEAFSARIASARQPQRSGYSMLRHTTSRLATSRRERDQHRVLTSMSTPTVDRRHHARLSTPGVAPLPCSGCARCGVPTLGTPAPVRHYAFAARWNRTHESCKPGAVARVTPLRPATGSSCRSRHTAGISKPYFRDRRPQTTRKPLRPAAWPVVPDVRPRHMDRCPTSRFVRLAH